MNFLQILQCVSAWVKKQILSFTYILLAKNGVTTFHSSLSLLKINCKRQTTKSAQFPVPFQVTSLSSVQQSFSARLELADQQSYPGLSLKHCHLIFSCFFYLFLLHAAAKHPSFAQLYLNGAYLSLNKKQLNCALSNLFAITLLKSTIRHQDTFAASEDVASHFSVSTSPLLCSYISRVIDLVRQVKQHQQQYEQ